MNMNKNSLEISDAKRLAKQLNARGVVIFAFGDNYYKAVSYGNTRADCAEFREWLEACGRWLEAA